MLRFVKILLIGPLMILSVVSGASAFSITYTIVFNENNFYFWQENGYDVIGHAGCYYYGDIGAPQVLVYSCSFIIPEDETVQSVVVNSGYSVQFQGQYSLIPRQYDDYYIRCCESNPPEWVEPDPKYYENNNPYPQDAALQGTEGYFDGANHIATVIILPIYYEPVDQEEAFRCFWFDCPQLVR